ncbi:cupin domain-containing protein [Streptomyces sp. CB01881]|uniref:JmjC domain-containing protein n=1 Tax=Streptomyces sp. CB01881 TaxID=2078691 RepID=UPI0013868375|nr:cupin domain-containing protein [Streptomyces sp. CB01881]
METLRSLVGDPAPFLATAWRREACLLRPPAPLAPPVTLADVDAVLASGLLRIPYLELVSQGKALEQGDYTSAHHLIDRSFRGYADTAKVMHHLDAGATLLMRNIEHWHSGAAALVDRLGAELGRGVEAFLFVTPPGQQGFGPHRDDADVFVLQLHGSKRWQIHAIPDDGRWQAGPEPDPGPVQLEATAHAGEVLYIPRGAPHSAVGHTDGLSFHLSLTVRQPGAADLRTALTRHLDDGLDLPPLPVDPVELRRTAAALLDHYRERLAGLTPEALCAAVETVPQPRTGAASPEPHRTLTNLAAALRN